MRFQQSINQNYAIMLDARANVPSRNVRRYRKIIVLLNFWCVVCARQGKVKEKVLGHFLGELMTLDGDVHEIRTDGLIATQWTKRFDKFTVVLSGGRQQWWPLLIITQPTDRPSNKSFQRKKKQPALFHQTIAYRHSCGMRELAVALAQLVDH